jgi:phosphate/sulfate permease
MANKTGLSVTSLPSPRTPATGNKIITVMGMAAINQNPATKGCLEIVASETVFMFASCYGITVSNFGNDIK